MPIVNVMEEHELKSAYIGEYPEETVQTFDFQNDGALNWTGNSIGYSTPDIETNQGWYIGTWAGAFQGGILPPSSVYGGTLKKYKIYFYKPGATTTSIGREVGIANAAEDNTIAYGRFNSGATGYINVNGNGISAEDLTGECSMEIIFENNGDVIVNLSDTSNTYTYNIGNYASVFQTLWSNSNLGLEIARWVNSSSNYKNYIRKVEITTE